MTLFLTETIDLDYVTLFPEESHHCVKVLRMGVGDNLLVTDGRGTMCHAEVSIPDARACQVRILDRQPHYQRRPFHLHIAVAPTKNNARIEWLVEKAVEIGVDEITPIICEHSERCTLKTDRLDKIIVSAMKQSLKAYKPLLHETLPLAQFLAQLSHSPSLPQSPAPMDRLVCYCDGNDRHSLSECYRPGNDALVLIGPEGDFSPAEIQAAFGVGFQSVTLGPCRLRTETAALYALTALNFLNS